MQITFQQTLFLIFGAITLGAALLAVTRRDVFHAALFLILSFFGVAGLYVLLEAPFLATAQLGVYAGGIAILFIFFIAPARDQANLTTAGRNRRWGAAALVSVALCGVLGWVALRHGWQTPSGPVPEQSIALLGAALVDPQGLALPFEVVAVLLLVALIGAATVARERS